MAEFLSNDVEVALSKAPESALNTQYTTIADFQRMLVAQPFFILPRPEKVTDEGRPGNGHDFATRVCNTYWTQPQVSVEDEIDFDLSAKAFRRALGSPVTFASVSSLFSKSFKMLAVASGRQLPSSDIITRLGGADFNLGGMVVEKWRMFQNRADRPRWAADFIGTGKFLKPAPTGVLTVPTYVCPSGSNVLIQWTDSGGVRNITGSGCKVLSWSVEVNNALKQNDRCSGDPTQVADASCADQAAAYVRTLLRSTRTVTAQIVIKLDSTLPEWIQMTCNELLSDVIFRVGATAAGLAATDTMQEAVLPFARIDSIEPGDDDGDATLTLNLKAYWDAVNGTAISGRLISAANTPWG